MLLSFAAVSVLPWAEAIACGGPNITTSVVISADCYYTGVLRLDTGADVTINSGVSIYNDGNGRNFDPAAVVTGTTSSRLTNNGTLYTGSQWAITINGALTSLINTGVIESGVRRGVVVLNTGSIGTLTNTGSILGPFSGVAVDPLGTIQTFNNLQGLGNPSGAVTYAGVLPTNYNVIIDGPHAYGQLSGLGVTGSMNFGVYNTSTVAAGTYANVLINIAAGNLTGALTGNYGGFNWQLSLASGSTTFWDLIFTVQPSMMAGSTYALADVGTSVTPVFDGGTLALLSGDSSAQAFTVNAGGGTLTSPTGGSAQLSGVFSGPGALTVDGTGVLALSGLNTYGGGTTVSSGTLDISGGSALGTGPVFVALGSTLRGTGTIAGAVTVAGTLKPGHSPGFLTVNSTVTMLSGSTYQEDIAGTTQASASTPAGSSGFYSFLDIVGGQFVIQPNATLMPRLSGLFTPGEPGFGSTPYTPVLGDRFRIVTADGGIAGQFSTLTQPAELTAGTRFVQLYDVGGSNSIDLAVVPTSYVATLADGNANARSAANALDQIISASVAGTATAAQTQLTLAAAGQTSASLPAFARGLSGEVYGATLAAVPQATRRMQRSVTSHLGDTAAVADGVSTFAMRERGAWGEVAYERGRTSNDGNASSFTRDLSQLVVGIDAYAKDGVKAGGGLALSSTDVDAAGGNGKVRQGALFVYAGMPQGEWMLDAMASVGVHSSDHSRSDVTGLTTGLGAKTHGRDALVGVGISKPLELSGMRASPYARLTLQHVQQSASNEGASASALTLDRFSGEAARVVVGLSLASSGMDPMKGAQTWRFNVGLGADSARLNNPALNASLAGASTLIRTPDTGSGFVQADFSGTFRIAPKAFAYAGISAEARRGAVAGGLNAGLRMQF